MFLRPSGAPEGRSTYQHVREHSDVHRFVLKAMPAALTRESCCEKDVETAASRGLVRRRNIYQVMSTHLD